MIRQPGALIFVILNLPWLLGAATAPTSTWQALHRGLSETRFTTIAVDPRNARLVYAASPRAVYESRDGGINWRTCWRASGGATVTSLAIDPFDSAHLLAATSAGLYGSSDGARHWQRLFSGTGGQRECRVVVFHPARRHDIYLGTGGGLFVSHDGGRAWQSFGSDLPIETVQHIAIDSHDPDRVYVVTDRAVFVSQSTDASWRKLFEVSSTEETVEEPEAIEEDGTAEPPPSSTLTTLAIDPQDSNHLYLASLHGLFSSADAGATWQRLTQLGLGTTHIQHLIVQAHSPTVAYAATPQGVARYRVAENRWDILYAGLPTHSIKFLAASATKLYAATDQGLYLLDLTDEELAQGNWPPAREILNNFVHEPTIEQVQHTAMRYGEVEPEKIARWRQQAAIQALLPKLSFDVAQKHDTYVTSMGSTTNPTFDRILTATDPSHNFGVSIDWDLGELIWNNDQTSIDTRSRLTTQLRQDILDEITRTYFERRRLQVELLTEPPADHHAQLEQELRVQELTAIIDGLTGGWFSKEIEMASFH